MTFVMNRRSLLQSIAASAVAPVLIVPMRNARAELQFDLRPGAFKPMPIAVADFGGDSEQSGRVAQVIVNNLRRSGYFTPLAKEKFPENPAADAVPNFEAWKATGVQALITGRTLKDGARLRTEFRLWEIATGQQATGQQLATDAANWRRVAHLVSDSVWEKIIGEKGHFDTRVVFVDESGPKEQRRKRLAIMDQDGANVRYLTSGSELVVTPRFSPNSQSIAYMAFSQGGDARVFVHQLESNQREAVGNFQGMSFSPRFSPQGNRLIMSLQQGSASNIYAYDLGSRATSRLTDGSSIDTSPSFSPDGSQIVFESDRGGQQQIYVMSAGGGAAKRVSFGDGSYSTPVWSPRGDLIAFTKRKGGNFAIGVMKPDGSGERILTEGFHNEGPTWSPNGRFLMFFRDPGGNAGAKIYMVDITGRVETTVPTPNFASDPAWGPRLSG
ncbi:MAG: Tol-Pal system beta propeller repeat protein TolB [Beijerinckiaceae bacterium]